MPTFADIPRELVLDSILPILSNRDILALGTTNRALLDLTSDSLLWEKRCGEDFNFAKSRLPEGYVFTWKALYKKLANPVMYGWGSPDSGRLGRPDVNEETALGDIRVSSPVILPSIPGSRIAKLVAGGWSMHALDSLGRIHVLGALDGSRPTHNSFGFDSPFKQAHQFHRLQLPVQFTTLSCSVNSMVALDTSGDVWSFTNWACPVRVKSPILDGSSPDGTITQFECGRRCRALLMQSGAVYVWWSSSPEGQVTVAAEDVNLGCNRIIKTIPCENIDCELSLCRVPDIPHTTLREANRRTLVESDPGDDGTMLKLVKISIVGLAIIGLTNRGHVLLFRNLEGPTFARSGVWEYLPEFSEADKIRQLLDDKDIPERNQARDLRMTTIASNSSTSRFIVYRPASSPTDCSTVLCGRASTSMLGSPVIVPELQDLPIASISLGDWHAVALTTDGRVFTWGNDLQGSLGLGDSMFERRIESPRQVQLFGPKERFCIGVTAMGWHSGALAIDLEEESNDSNSSKSRPGEGRDSLTRLMVPMPRLVKDNRLE